MKFRNFREYLVLAIEQGLTVEEFGYFLKLITKLNRSGFSMPT